MTSLVKNLLTQCLPIALIGIVSTLLMLFLMFFQAGIFNLNELASGASLIPLIGDCASSMHGTCMRMNTTKFYSCNGPLQCPGRISDLFYRPVQLIGVLPGAGPRHNDTTVQDIIDLIIEEKLHLTAFIMVVGQQLLGWISLLMLHINRRWIKITGIVIFLLTRSLGFVAVHLNTQATLNDIKVNFDYPPKFLVALNIGLPLFAFGVALVEMLGFGILLVRRLLDEQPREIVLDIQTERLLA